MMHGRRGVILPVVLFILILVGLLGARFAFRVHADASSLQAATYQIQTRLAAEAGIERVKILLRDPQFSLSDWYHNPDEFHRIIVWAHDEDSTVLGTNDELDEGAMVYRFSLVADDPTDDEDFIRFGLTDEASKVNLNTATEAQLLALITAAVEGEGEVDPKEILDAILDWRDADRIPRGRSGDTEDVYYRSLEKPYRVRNGPFDTVEELLLVKGVTGRILYGEDYDRNGLLTPNEDDGDLSFPPDNEDGKLNRGLYPYLTVYSYETNVSNDRQPRVYLFDTNDKLTAGLEGIFPDDPGIVSFIASAAKASRASGAGNAAEQAERDRQRRRRSRGKSNLASKEFEDDESYFQVEPDPDSSTGTPDPGDEEGEMPDNADATESEESDEGSSTPETGGAVPGSQPIRSPVSLLLARETDGQIQESPLTLEHLSILLDRTTVVAPDTREIPGLINVNTAPALVLSTLAPITAEQVEAIVERRDGLDDEMKSTPAWLVTEGLVDLDTFDRIAGRITARAQQFRIESLGYADHVGTMTRLEVVLDLVGPIAQTIHYRDLTRLGGHFPIREEDEERIRGR